MHQTRLTAFTCRTTQRGIPGKMAASELSVQIPGMVQL